MSKHALRQMSVATLLMALLSFHVLHLHSSWRASTRPFAVAYYAVPPSLNAGLRNASQGLEQILRSRLKADNQLSEGNNLGILPIYEANIIHVSFAPREPQPDLTVKQLARDFQEAILQSMPPALSAKGTSTICPAQNGPRCEVTLVSLNIRYGSGIKALDIISLMVLAGALFIWLRSGRRQPVASTE